MTPAYGAPSSVSPTNWRAAFVKIVEDVDVSLPLFIALVIGGVWLWLFLRARQQTPRSPEEGRWRLFLGALAIGGAVIGVLNQAAPVAARWRWHLAAFPSVIILAHGFTLSRLRRLDTSTTAASDADAPALEEIKRSVSRNFGALTLIVRYGIPAFFIYWLGLGIANTLFSELVEAHMVGAGSQAANCPEGWPLGLVIAAAYGLAGSYSYVMLALGSRSFLYDITPGSAMWCAVTMVIGPLVAGVCGMFWPPARSLSGSTASQIRHIAAFFIIGFSPRYGLGLIAAFARGHLQSINSEEADSARYLPITQLSGVTPNIAERLAEEGLTSVDAVAAADPVRLLRATRYDKRLIVDWIDSAMLMQALPKDWEKLQRVGISKATELAALAPTRVAQPPPAAAITTAPAAELAEPQLPAGTLAQLASIASVHPKVLETKAEMFLVDPAVRMLKMVRWMRFENETGRD